MMLLGGLARSIVGGCWRPLCTDVTTNNCYDVIVVGGGIVGVASALDLVRRRPDLSVAVVEKESRLAAHQSGRNSGVVHAGIYYKPGSLRAKLCTEGMRLAYRYLDSKSVPYRKVGKLIVATDDTEVPALDLLYKRGLENGVQDLKLLSSAEIPLIEPYCTGVKAIHSPHTGIVDWGYVTTVMADDFVSRGGRVLLDYEVIRFEESRDSGHCVDTTKYPIRLVDKCQRQIHSGYVLCCGGLYSDKLAVLCGGSPNPPIVPVRGEYLQLTQEKRHLVTGNIYPVPDARFPFLGVHFTPRMDGSVWLGPNAVLAASRQGYSYGDINVKELFETVKFSGVRKLGFKYYDFALNELAGSLLPRLLVKRLNKFIPSLRPQDVLRGPSGVRAQAVSEDGSLIEDFVLDETGGRGAEDSVWSGRVLHCRNAPSPAATSSLAIASILSDKIFGLMAISH